MREYNKPEHFLVEYKNLFEEFKDKKGKILEIGIQKGGSLELWEDWLPNFQVVGVDILDCRSFGTERIKILNTEQTDECILKEALFDIIIDDGGHTMKQQKGSFKMLFPVLNKGGLYIIEDVETSYYDSFIDEKPTTIGFLKTLVDSVNRLSIESSRAGEGKVPYPDYKIEYIKFLDNLVVIKKTL